MKKTTPAHSDHKPRGRHFRRPRLLIVGCGDVGGRILSRLAGRYRIVALTSSPPRVIPLRAAGAVPIVGNLDRRATLSRLAAFRQRVIHLAPPPEAAGRRDPRTRTLLAALLGRPGRLVYVSTTGVYGDRGGGEVDETTTVAPGNERAWRRLDAERRVRDAGGCVLRAPGIYAHDRLPTARLIGGAPALAPEDDIFTNHIHADDLARICIAGLHRGGRGRVYNTVDRSRLKMGEYFDLVADRLRLPRPPRLSRAQLKAAVSPMMYSFMAESRRVSGRRVERELRVRLKWPTVAATLDSLAAASSGADEAHESRSAGRKG
jgi:nucleoside-diphosphate-sugar epimerase